MKSPYACLLAIAFTSVPAVAADAVFTGLEDAYLTVLTDSISVRRTPTNQYAVAIGRSRAPDYWFIPLPETMWTKLAGRLKAKGVDPSQFVSLADIGWNDEDRQRFLIHKPTGKDAWIYFIDSVVWHGDTRLRVSQRVYHGGLESYGCTVVLEKKDGKWVIVERTDRWIS